MNMNKNSNDVMFLFGAGISIPIGIPAMAGIYQGFMDKKKSEITINNLKICKIFTEEMGVSHDLEEFLLAANAILNFKKSELSHFISRNISKTKNSNKLKEFNRNIESSTIEVQNVKNGILDFLSKICFQFDRNAAIKINSGFVKTIAKMGYSVYSTNYDFAFEYVAIEENISISDNFIKKGQRHLWNKDIQFDSENSFKLIKLHGSVTWYQDSSGEIEKIYSSTAINPMGKKVENIVIVPTRFKDIYDQHFFALYSHFLSSLSKAKVLVIAGHSLRDDYLRAAIIERKRKGGFQLVVIDPNYPSEIKSELPPARKGSAGEIMHLPYKWEEISDELSHILATTEPEDIIKALSNVYKKHQRIKNKIKIKGSIRKLTIEKSVEVNVEIVAYLPMTTKPCYLRSWIEATYTDTDGKTQNRICTSFVDEKIKVFGDGLTGLIDEAVNFKIKVPKIQSWITYNAEVKIVVALVRSTASAPKNVNIRTLIAKDEKIVKYLK